VLNLSEHYPLFTLPVVFILWFFTFQIQFSDFWFRIGFSTLVLLLLSLVKSKGLGIRPNVKGIIIGLASGVLLYLFFWTGFQLLRGNPVFLSQVGSVYSFKSQQSPSVIAALLLFPGAPGEEMYWRGLIQRYFSKRWAGIRAILITSALYSLIHISTLNPSLMFVALVGGLVWGYLFHRFSNIIPSMISHIVFDEFVFVLFVFA
jgi:membrane protease YdiL (CAAX protease family)